MARAHSVCAWRAVRDSDPLPSPVLGDALPKVLTTHIRPPSALPAGAFMRLAGERGLNPRLMRQEVRIRISPALR